MFFWRLLHCLFTTICFLSQQIFASHAVIFQRDDKDNWRSKIILSLNAQAEFQFSRSFSLRNFPSCHRSGVVNLRPLSFKAAVNNQEQTTKRPRRLLLQTKTAQYWYDSTFQITETPLVPSKIVLDQNRNCVLAFGTDFSLENPINKKF